MAFIRQRALALVVLSLLAIATIVGIRLTSGTDQSLNISRRRNVGQQEQQSRTSQRSFDAACDLAKLANTRDEDRISREAIQLADHDLDLSFTTALREGQLHPAAPTPKTKELRDRIRDIDAQIKDDQAKVIKLSSSLRDAHGNENEQVQRQLDLIQAEFNLHSEELEDAKQDLARTGDDVETRI